MEKRAPAKTRECQRGYVDVCSRRVCDVDDARVWCIASLRASAISASIRRRVCAAAARDKRRDIGDEWCKGRVYDASDAMRYSDVKKKQK